MPARVFAGVLCAGLGLIVAGCQSNDGANILNLGLTGNNQQQQQPDTRITAAELRAYCPRVELREGTAYFNAYERGGQDDPDRVIYQASISDVTRSCSYADGTLTMNVAVAGKVVPGPKGSAGEITMPIRVAVVQGGNVVYSELHRHSVAIGDTGAAQFVFSDPAVTLPAPQERNVLVFAGYDEGPYDTP